MNNNTPMLFGKYIGVPIKDIPASYLLWLWEQKFIQNPMTMLHSAVRDYIKNNLEVLKKDQQR